jgi:hypothetical protein
MKRLIAGCIVVSLVAACWQARVASQTKTAGKKSGPPAGAGAEIARTRWEYSVLSKEAVVKAGKGDFRAGLNALGEEGWELVTIEARFSAGRGAPGGGRATAYYFKRAKGATTKEIPLGPPSARRKGEALPKELTHLFRLRYAKAPTLAKTLKEVYAEKSTLRIVSDERTNHLILVGSIDQIDDTARLIRELDAPVAEPKAKGK